MLPKCCQKSRNPIFFLRSPNIRLGKPIFFHGNPTKSLLEEAQPGWKSPVTQFFFLGAALWGPRGAASICGTPDRFLENRAASRDFGLAAASKIKGNNCKYRGNNCWAPKICLETHVKMMIFLSKKSPSEIDFFGTCIAMEFGLWPHETPTSIKKRASQKRCNP